MSVCGTCSDGASCDTCVTSNPAREGSTCTAPDGFFDDGVN
jgi:hypothetical protein